MSSIPSPHPGLSSGEGEPFPVVENKLRAGFADALLRFSLSLRRGGVRGKGAFLYGYCSRLEMLRLLIFIDFYS